MRIGNQRCYKLLTYILKTTGRTSFNSFSIFSFPLTRSKNIYKTRQAQDTHFKSNEERKKKFNIPLREKKFERKIVEVFCACICVFVISRRMSGAASAFLSIAPNNIVKWEQKTHTEFQPMFDYFVKEKQMKDRLTTRKEN